MNEHLLKRVQEGKLPQGEAEIINEIIILLEKLGDKEASTILKNYKKKDDEIIYEDLLQHNTFFDKSKVKGSNQKPGYVKQFISIADGVLNVDVWNLYCIKCNDSYDHNKMKPVYELIVNPSENGSGLTNMVVSFYSAKAREKEILSLKEKLKKFNIIFT